jgi:hypothetical protein
MRRSLVVLSCVAVALLVSVRLLLVATPGGVAFAPRLPVTGVSTPIAVPPAGLTVAPPPHPDERPVRLDLQVATYFQAPTATLVIDVLGRRGRSLSRCRIPPTAYFDNQVVHCVVERRGSIQRVRIHAVGGKGQVAIWTVKPAEGPLTAGWFADPVSNHSLRSRLSFALDRLDAVRPAIFGVWTLLIAAGLAAALTLAGFVAVLRLPDDGTESS